MLRRYLLRQCVVRREAVDANGPRGSAEGAFPVLEPRHQVELHNLTGRIVECPFGRSIEPRADRLIPCGASPRLATRAPPRPRGYISDVLAT